MKYEYIYGTKFIKAVVSIQCIFLYINSIYCCHHHHTSLRHTNNNNTIPGTLLPVQLEHFLIMWMEIFSCVKCRHWTSRHDQRHITDWVERIGLASRPITSYTLKEGLQWLALKKIPVLIFFSGTGFQSNQIQESFQEVSTVLCTPLGAKKKCST